MEKMELSITGYQHAAFASQETPCFRCNVLVNGRKVAIVSNDGNGGDNMWEELHGFRGIREKITAYAKATKPTTKKVLGDQEYTFEPDADSWIHELMDRLESSKKLKRLLGQKLVFTSSDGKGVFTAKVKNTSLKMALANPAFVKAAREAHSIKDLLNEMPFDKALDIFHAETA